MATQVQLRRGTTTEHSSFTGASGEVTVDTTKKTLVVHDGVTVGGNPVATASNPNFSGNAVISDNSANAALRVTQVGSGNAILVEDSANPDSTPFVVDSSGKVIIGTTSTPNIEGFQRLFYMGTAGVGSQAVFQEYLNNSTGPQLWLSKTRGTTAGSKTIVQDGDELGAIRFLGTDGTTDLAGANIRALVDGTPGTNDMPGRLVFSTTADGASSPTERMRIGSLGTVGIGTSNASNRLVRIGGNTVAASNISYSLEANPAIQSDVVSYRGIASEPSISNAVFTISDLYSFYASQGTKGASATITNQYGFFANSSLVGATNNYGFYSNIASGTGRWNFYAAGTADNYFAGSVGIGTATTPATAKLRVLQGANQVAFLSEGANSPGYPQFGFAGQTSDNGGRGAGMYLPADSTLSFSTTAVERMRIAANGTISLGAAPGAESLRVTPVASAVNYVNVTGNPTGYSPQIKAEGSDANVGFSFITKGTAGYSFYTNAGVPQFAINHTASAVNYLQVTGAATGNGVSVSAQGSDANIDIALVPKGTGGTNINTSATLGSNAGDSQRIAQFYNAVNGNSSLLRIGTYRHTAGTSWVTASTRIQAATDSVLQSFIEFNPIGNQHGIAINAAGGYIQFKTANETLQFNVTHTASAVNYLQVTGGAAGVGVVLSSQGADANINNYYSTKGGGSHSFWSGGGQQFLIAHTASAVNYLQVRGEATGARPILEATGSDANVGIYLTTKGTGSYEFHTGGARQFSISNVTSAVNFLQVAGNTTGNPVQVLAAGSDTNIDLALTPKGTGNVKFGTFTTNADTAITGYITIKDSAGNVRKLAVIA